MIFIRALETAINNNNESTENIYHDSLRARINYAFAHRLRHYILNKSVDSCMLFKNSPEESDRSMAYFVTYYSPDVVIYIDCAYDVDDSVHGYHISCDKYTTLVKTIIYETHMQEQEFTYDKDGEEVTEVLNLIPDTDKGYSIDRSLTYGSVADIQINLGYLSSNLDSQYLNDDSLTTIAGLKYDDENYKYHLVEDCTLDLIARRIVEGAYGPPIVEYTNDDPVGNTDPYFYSINDWVPYIEDSKSSGEIVSELYNNIPINSLKITGNNEVLYLGEDDLTNYTENYTWQSWSTYDSPTSCHFICSYKTNGVDVVAYISVGDYVFTKTLNSVDYTVLNFTVDVNTFDDIRIGVEGIGTIWFTGIWLSPKEVIGNIDDPRTKYSMYPPGYRTRTSNDVPVYNGSDPITVAITSATDLIGRAREVVDADSSSNDNNTDEDASTAQELVAQYSSVSNSVLSQSANNDLTDAKIIFSPASLSASASSAASSLMNKAASVTGLLGKFMLISAASSMFSTSKSSSQEQWSAPADWSKDDRTFIGNKWNDYATAKNEWIAAKDKKSSAEKEEKDAIKRKEDAVKQAGKDVDSAIESKGSAQKELDAANTVVANREAAIASTTDPDAKKILEGMLVEDKKAQSSANEKYERASEALVKAQENKKTADSNAAKPTETSTKDKVTDAAIEDLKNKKDAAKKAFDDALKMLKEKYKKEAKEKKDVVKQYNDKISAENKAKENLDKANKKAVELNNQIIDYTLKLQDSSTSASDLNKISSKLSSAKLELEKVNESIPKLEEAYNNAVSSRKEFYSNNKDKLS